MVTIDAVVGELLGVVKRLRELLFGHRLERLGEISDDFGGFIVDEQRGLEELAGCWDIPAFGDENVDDLAALVDCPIGISLGTGDLDVGFVNKPTIANRVAARAGGVDEQGSEALDSSVDRHMIDFDATFSEEFLNVSVGEPVAEVPANGEHDDLRLGICIG